MLHVHLSHSRLFMISHTVSMDKPMYEADTTIFFPFCHCIMILAIHHVQICTVATRQTFSFVFWSMSCMHPFIWTNFINDAKTYPGSRCLLKVNICLKKKIFGQQPCRHRSLRLPSYNLRGAVLPFQPWRVAAVIDGGYPFLSPAFVKKTLPHCESSPPPLDDKQPHGRAPLHARTVSFRCSQKWAGKKKITEFLKPTPAKRTIKKNEMFKALLCRHEKRVQRLTPKPNKISTNRLRFQN